MNERITIEGLGLMVKQGFDRVDSQFENLGLMVKQGFDQVDKRFETVEERLDRMELRLDQAAYRFELVELTHRVQNIENKIGL